MGDVAIIVDVIDPDVETVVLDFDLIEDFDHEDLVQTIRSAQRFLADRDNFDCWRFDSLRMDWENRRCELDYLRLR